ncbi:hypothetical protein J3R30DRAFT_1396594 [Lentinula aciculospora]|uniref:Uncharacterized protein n=1 Tax=Lentinula aciculospora TaxID=153920 RepID=A0A9W9APB2_9AGAR|nr:hypothetical protein J3R30DRAFT_1396594 [Lentinula aciculospora]
MLASGAPQIITSEVAMMSAVSHLNLRAPKVLARASYFKNPVRIPYNIMKDVDGVSLGDDWMNRDMRGIPVATMILQVCIPMFRSARPLFNQLGSLYFTNDHPSSRSLLAPEQIGRFPGLEDTITVGPIADVHFTTHIVSSGVHGTISRTIFSQEEIPKIELGVAHESVIYLLEFWTS